MQHFVIMGPGKAGSTWCYNAMRLHPEVSVPKVKETYFFSNDDSTIEYYEDMFDFKFENKCFGDFSNQYYKDISFIDRVLLHYPNTKFVYLWRNPIDRAASVIKFERMQGRSYSIEQFKKDWEIKLFDNSKIVDGVLQKVRSDNLLILKFDTITQTPAIAFQELCDFFEVAQIPVDLTRVYQNNSVLPRYRLLVRLGKFVAEVLRKYRMHQVLQILKNSETVRTLFYSKSSIRIEDYEYIEIKKHFKEIL